MPIKIRWLISYFYADKFVVGVVAFIRKNDKILLLKHSYHYHWSLPGGFLKKKEDAYTAIKREIKEETGLDIKVNDILKIHYGSKKPILDIIVDCQLVGGKIKVDEKEIKSAKFFPINELPLNDILNIHREYIKEYKSNPS
ncbi:MAG: NUDIX hydrolase [Candidatus Moranbacteria bacterium]|nr:NUDIX hydrolase [Candidatus Moranbacteria bacterium]